MAPITGRSSTLVVATCVPGTILDGDRARIRATSGRRMVVAFDPPVIGVVVGAVAAVAVVAAVSVAPPSASTARASVRESSRVLKRARREATSTADATPSGPSSATITAVTALAASSRSATSPPRTARACHRARVNVRVRAPGVGGTSSTCHGRYCTGPSRRTGNCRDRGSACWAGIGRGGVAPRMGMMAEAAGSPAAGMTTPVYRGVERCIGTVSGSRPARRPPAAGARRSHHSCAAASRCGHSPHPPPAQGPPGS